MTPEEKLQKCADEARKHVSHYPKSWASILLAEWIDALCAKLEGDEMKIEQKLCDLEIKVRELEKVRETLAKLEARIVTIEEELDHCDVVRSFRDHRRYSGGLDANASQGGHALGPGGQNSWVRPYRSWGDWPPGVPATVSPELRSTLLDLLRFFQNGARVIFQLAPRDTGSTASVMVGELRHALGVPNDPKARSLLDGEEASGGRPKTYDTDPGA